MKHKFDSIIISISGVCKECKNYIHNKGALTTLETEQFIAGPGELRALKLETIFEELDQHECKPS